MTARSRRHVPNSNKPSWQRTLTILCVLAAASLLLAPTASASNDAVTAATAGSNRAITPSLATTGDLLQITNQTTFVAADGKLTLDLDVALGDLVPELADAAPVEPDDGTNNRLTATPSPLDRFSIEVTVFSRLTDESEVALPATRPLNRIAPVPLSDLPTIIDGVGRELYRLELPVRSGDPFDTQERVLIPAPGVYPITVELRDTNGLLATRRSQFIRLDQETSGEATVAPIPVAILLPVTAADGLTLKDAIGLMGDHPTHPMTVSLQEGTQSQLRSDPDATARFLENVGARQVIASSNLDLDPSALADISQEPIYADAMASSRQSFEDMGVSITPKMTVIDTFLTRQGAQALHAAGIETVITDQSGYLNVGANKLQLISIDEDLSATFATEDSGPVVAAQVLAKLVLRGETNRSAVVLGGHSMGQRPLAALNAFLVALSQPGAPRPVAVADITQDTRLRPAEQPAQDLHPIATSLLGIQATIATYETSYQAGGIPPQEFRNRMLASLGRNISQIDRERSLDLVAQQLDEELNIVSLPEAQPVNLAARSAPIPLVVESRAKGPRMVMVKFVSDKVSVSMNEQIIVIDPGTSSVDVEVEARSLGVSPLEVSIWTPDGERQLALTTFQVRSTAIPGVGLLLSSIGIVMLASWWWIDNRRRTTERIHAKAASIAISME